MSYYGEDFYQEPSEFEQQIDEFKESLLKSVKEDYKSEMERLRTENAELQKVKKDWENIKYEMASKIRELEQERVDLTRKVRRERLDEIMGDAKVIMYSPEYIYFDARKCERCNDERKIEYVTPLGNQAREACTCNQKIIFWKPAENELHEMYLSHRNNNSSFYYRLIKDSDYDSVENKASHSAGNIFIPGQTTYKEVEEGWYRRFYFESVEECQKYCIWKMEKDAGILVEEAPQ